MANVAAVFVAWASAVTRALAKPSAAVALVRCARLPACASAACLERTAARATRPAASTASVLNVPTTVTAPGAAAIPARAAVGNTRKKNRYASSLVEPAWRNEPTDSARMYKRSGICVSGGIFAAFRGSHAETRRRLASRRQSMVVPGLGADIGLSRNPSESNWRVAAQVASHRRQRLGSRLLQ